MTTTEIRGVWLTTTASQVLNSRSNIESAMDFLAETGFNVVFPVVWNQGVTQYPSRVMQHNFGIEIDQHTQGCDRLGEVVTAAHKVGLKVIPWFEYGFASSYNSNGGMLLAKKPEWAARDCKGNLLNKNGFEWLNALDPQVQNFISDLVLEVVHNYNVDGIQGDDRLPALPCEGGYDKGTVARYRQQFGLNPPSNPKNPQWLQWRADILTNFWENLYKQVKAINQQLFVSISPNIHDWAFKEYLQDSPKWLEKNLVDMIHPQIYRRDFASYKSIINKLAQKQFNNRNLAKLAPGILIKLGHYTISSHHLVQAIEYNRAHGICGEVFFFYEGLRDNNNALAKFLKTECYHQQAAFPSLDQLNSTQAD